MKELFKIFIAGIVGGLIVLCGIKYTQESQYVESSYAKAVNLNVNPSMAGMAAQIDFVDASEKSMDVVVHISAEESEGLAQERLQEQRQSRRSPFDGIFSLEDIFGGGSGFYRQKGSGSGVIIANDGYIVTNNHVVAFADNIKVTLHDGREYQAIKIGTDPSTDLAVIKIEERELPVLKLADSDMSKVGEWVLAVGNPFDYLTSTVTAGIISAKGRDIDIIKGQKSIEEFIQTDAAINPGNSGGALVNVKGELLGINTAIATPTGTYAGYSFAIPSNLMKIIVDEIIATGDIERANLGVGGENIIDLEEDFIKKNHIKLKSGFYVFQVENGSAAQFSGIVEGDIITELDKKEISNFDDLKEAMKFTKVGDSVEVKVNRKGGVKTFNIRLKKSS